MKRKREKPSSIYDDDEMSTISKKRKLELAEEINLNNKFSSLDKLPFRWKKNKRQRMNEKTKEEIQSELMKLQSEKQQHEYEKRIAEESRELLDRERNLIKYQAQLEERRLQSKSNGGNVNINEFLDNIYEGGMSGSGIIEDDQIFYLKQAKLRAELRIKSKRFYPIDIILLKLFSNFRIPFIPYKMNKYLNFKELNFFLGEIDNQIKFGLNKIAVKEFWKPMRILVEKKVAKLKTKMLKEKDETLITRRNESFDGIHKSVKGEIKEILVGKGYEELCELEEEVNEMLKTQDNIDVDYWQSLLKYLTINKAKSLIVKFNKSLKPSNFVISNKEEEEEEEKILNDDGIINDNIDYEDYFKCRMEEAEKRLKELETSNERVKVDPNSRKFIMATEEEFVRFTKTHTNEADKVLVAEEIEVEIENEFNIKHKNRDPPLINVKYFHKVNMGYNWNWYNRAHYDTDNPPPKTEKRYKFNFHCPEAKERPSYYILRQNDFKIVVFHFGEPYRDLGFKIVNKEWETSERRGFRCSFDRGIFHLHFSLKKKRYRR